MFFSKVALFAFFFAALSVLATPHALHHHALHRRVVAARAASVSNSTVSVKRQNSAKCIHRPSSSASSSTVPTPSPIVAPETTHSPTASFTPAPAPSSSSTPHQQPAPPATSAAAPSPPSGADGPFSGDGTFFATGLGACGIVNVATDSIVAVSEIRYDAAATNDNPNDNPLCGKQVSITYGGNTHTATITDRCTGCSKDSLDMTTGLFQIFASLDVGRIHDIEWSFI